MRRRQRKLVGVAATLAFVIVYALVAMALAQARFVMGAPDLLQWLYYAIIGLAWVVPLMPLIRWMERPDDDLPHEGWFDGQSSDDRASLS